MYTCMCKCWYLAILSIFRICLKKKFNRKSRKLSAKLLWYLTLHHIYIRKWWTGNEHETNRTADLQGFIRNVKQKGPTFSVTSWVTLTAQARESNFELVPHPNLINFKLKIIYTSYLPLHDSYSIKSCELIYLKKKLF